MPYQLHCWPEVELTLDATEELVLGAEDFDEDELLVTTLELTFDELLEVATLELDVDGAELDVVPPAQAAPEITGISALAPPLVPWIPNSADCPGWIVLFQLKPVAA